MKLAKNLVRLSAYSHSEEHLRVKTPLGGLVTLIGAVLAVVMFISEAHRCMRLRLVQDMVVDTDLTPTLHLEYDIIFPRLPCTAVRMDSGDVSGNFETETMQKVIHNGELHKWRLDYLGRRIERVEYIAPRNNMDNPFIMTFNPEDMDRVRQAVIAEEGCQMNGWLEVSRVAGNVHFGVRTEAMLAVSAAGEVFAEMMHQHLGDFKHTQLNSSHVINRLRFGKATFPGQVQPLEGVRRIDRKATGIDKYYLKIVPTKYTSTWGRSTETYQHSVTEYYKKLPKVGAQGMPGVYLMYDMSPIKMIITANRLGWLHLLVRACAVCGGMWTVAGLTDRLLHRLQKAATKLAKTGSAP